jgi:hypothetical protein
VFHDVIIQKDATFNVVLAQQMTAAGHMTVNNNLNFNAAGASRIVTGNFDLKMGATASVTGADADEYVATTGTGMMQKTVTANGTFAFPIGDLTNYSPISSTYTGSAYAAANIRTKANDAVHPDKPTDATEYITRYWDVNATGITGYSNTLTGTYIPADLTLGGGGTAAQVKGAVYDGAEWSYAAAASGANIVIGSTNDATADFTGTNFFGKTDIIAFLNGPYNTSTGLMSTTLNSAGIIPLTSPYADAPASVGAIPAGVTDWIKLELRDTGSPGTVLGKASAFNPTDYNFSLALANAYDNPAITTNDAMRLMSDGKYVMWGGNANGNVNVRYTTGSGDEAYLLGTVLMGNTATVITGPAAYNGADMNMNAIIRYTTGSGDEAFLLGNVLGGNTATVINQHQ